MKSNTLIFLLVAIQNSAIGFIIKNTDGKKNSVDIQNQLDETHAINNKIGPSKQLIEDQDTLITLLEGVNRIEKKHELHKHPKTKSIKIIIKSFQNRIKKFIKSKEIKTSLRELKRSRRRSTYKMISDEDAEYDILSLPHRAVNDVDIDSDYTYDLYDDEGDADLSARTRQYMEYGSFQDLILQAQKSKWERENEEKKLHHTNDFFI